MRNSPNRIVATVFGAVYVLVGLLGFAVTGGVGFIATEGGLLLGVFQVNPLHNIAHLLIGAALLIAGFANVVGREDRQHRRGRRLPAARHRRLLPRRHRGEHPGAEHRRPLPAPRERHRAARRRDSEPSAPHAWRRPREPRHERTDDAGANLADAVRPRRRPRAARPRRRCGGNGRGRPGRGRHRRPRLGRPLAPRRAGDRPRGRARRERRTARGRGRPRGHRRRRDDRGRGRPARRGIRLHRGRGRAHRVRGASTSPSRLARSPTRSGQRMPRPARPSTAGSRSWASWRAPCSSPVSPRRHSPRPRPGELAVPHGEHGGTSVTDADHGETDTTTDGDRGCVATTPPVAPSHGAHPARAGRRGHPRRSRGARRP